MRFFSVCTFTLSTIASLVAAGENPIIYPAVNTVVQSGTTIEVTWTPTTSTSGKIDLVLRYGPTANLLTGNPVASKILNSGSYIWNVPTNIGNGEWSIAILDGNNADTNYSPMFTIQGGSGKQGSPGSPTATASSASITYGARVLNTMAATITGNAQSSTPTGAAMKLGSAGGLAAAVGFGALAALA